ncbi:MAG: IS110 family transposase [bacterium]|nr:IS110 family transposase [bacterium]
MKKNSMSRIEMWKRSEGPLTMGLDLGDRQSQLCVLNSKGDVVWNDREATTKKSLGKLFREAPASRVVMELGTHSTSESRRAGADGRAVGVANAQNEAYITRSSRKSDSVDAEALARLRRVDPKLLGPIRHRSEQAQGDLAVIRARAALVEARTKLVNSARGIAKAMGERLASCDADQMGPLLLINHSQPVREALCALLKEVEQLTATLREYNQQIAELAKQYPETARLKKVYGVGDLVALTYVLTLEDPSRFRRSREVGPYLGLRPRERQSGSNQPQLRITKEGDRYLRTLLVQSAHVLLQTRAPDSDLKRFGERLAARGGKNARKRAVVAVARKLAVLLHKLWRSGELYKPLYLDQSPSAAKAA